MGRPIKSKFFGNRNRGGDNENTGGTGQGQTSGVGGEGITITVSNSGTVYSQGITFTVGAPNIAGGIQATVSSSVNSAGNVTLTVNDAGTGYTSAPTINLVKPTTVNTVGTATNAQYTLTNLTSVAGIYIGMRADADWGMQASSYVTAVNGNSVTLSKTMVASTSSLALTFSDQGASFAKTVGLTSSVQNALAITTYLTTGSSAVNSGDIIKQESSRRYLVRNSQGIGQVRLVASDTLSAGQMKIIATDGSGATYFVKKLTAKKAYLVNRTSTSTAVVTGLVAQWTANSSQGNTLITAATGTTQVSISSN